MLDTNVLLHDPSSLFRFDEHDIYLPMITLEELDGHKKGMSEVARNARQVSRDLDALAGSAITTHQTAATRQACHQPCQRLRLPVAWSALEVCCLFIMPLVTRCCGWTNGRQRAVHGPGKFAHPH